MACGVEFKKQPETACVCDAPVDVKEDRDDSDPLNVAWCLDEHRLEI